jgi:hypothetical protein
MSNHPEDIRQWREDQAEGKPWSENERSEPQHPGCAGCGIALPIEIGETVTVGDPCPNCFRPIPGFIVIPTITWSPADGDHQKGTLMPAYTNERCPCPPCAPYDPWISETCQLDTHQECANDVLRLPCECSCHLQHLLCANCGGELRIGQESPLVNGHVFHPECFLYTIVTRSE